jgi:hypothetical protein
MYAPKIVPRAYTAAIKCTSVVDENITPNNTSIERR